MQHNSESNKIFEYAASFIQYTNRSVFLTGRAGTGKTTFLKHIKEQGTKKMVVVAPTGVAAINAGGVTIHSFFLLPLGTYIHNYRSPWGESDIHVYNRNQLLSKLRYNQNKREVLRELELLVIDEISMVRADVLDAVDAILRSVRRRPYEAFGGVQVLYIGDMFQLPPIVRQQEKGLMDSVYPTAYFFDSLVANEAPPVFIELKKIYRQHDDNFINILNHIRNNTISQEELDILHQYYDPHFSPTTDMGYITLTSHNYQADDINRSELEKLRSTTYEIEAVIEKDFPENAYPVAKVLHIKKGAQIMFIKNDKGEKRRYYNGKIGTIEDICDGGDKIKIRFNDEADLLELEKETWRNIKYKYDNTNDEMQEEVLGTFTQFPIRLAWAITIHKSQGLTFEKAIIDAGQSFAPGQVYVALSRLTGLEGLVLRSHITPYAIATDERIISFYDRQLSDEALNDSLIASQKEFVSISLIHAFDFEKIYDVIYTHFQETNFNKLADGEKAMPIIATLSSNIDNIKTTAIKFLPQLHGYLEKKDAGYESLHHRLSVAIPWFEKNLDEDIIVPLKLHVKDWKVKSRTKKYCEALSAILLQCERKKIQLQQALQTTSDIVMSGNWENVMESVTRMNSPNLLVDKSEEEEKESSKRKGNSKLISLEMYQEGKSIEQIATERSLAQSTISGHLTEFVSTGEIHVSKFVSDEKLDILLKQFAQHPEILHAELKSKLGDDYSYTEIKAAHQYFKLMSNK